MSSNNYSADNNQAVLVGSVKYDFEYDHTMLDEKFYNNILCIQRLSGYIDEIPLLVSERLIDVSSCTSGTFVQVIGQFRSYNLKSDEYEKPRLKLNLFVTEITILDEDDDISNQNEIYLNGYICKVPKYRKTSLGREITDLLIAVNRAYRKSDYLPCIAWGRNAKYVESLEVGTHIELNGRIQSRGYSKKIDEDNYEQRIAYEVSVYKIAQALEDDEITDEDDIENTDE